MLHWHANALAYGCVGVQMRWRADALACGCVGSEQTRMTVKKNEKKNERKRKERKGKLTKYKCGWCWMMRMVLNADGEGR